MLEDMFFGVPGALVLAIILFALVEIGLMVWALVDISRRKHVRGNNKIVWILGIVIFGTIGPIIYLLLGRVDEPKEEERYEQ